MSASLLVLEKVVKVGLSRSPPDLFCPQWLGLSNILLQILIQLDSAGRHDVLSGIMDVRTSYSYISKKTVLKHGLEEHRLSTIEQHIHDTTAKDPWNTWSDPCVNTFVAMDIVR